MTVITTRRRGVAALCIACAAIVGCATATPAGQRWRKEPVPVAAAGFRLQGIRVQWQDNPAFSYRFSYTTSRYAPNTGPSDAQRAQVQAQMKEILEFYRNEAVPRLTQAMVDEGVPAGAEHRIVLTPLTAFQSTGGSGTTFTMRATVLDSANRPVWSTDVESYSGLQVFGPRFSKPDDSYVRNFVASLTDTMRKAGLVGKA
jgi:hypothetical protein